VLNVDKKVNAVLGTCGLTFHTLYSFYREYQYMCGDTASGILMGLTLSKIISRLLIGCIKQQPQSPQSLLICWYNFMHRALAWIATQSRPCIFMIWPP